MAEHRSAVTLLHSAVPGTDLAAWDSRSLGVCSDVVSGLLRDLSARSPLAFMVLSPSISRSSFMFVFLNKQGAVFSKPVKITSFNAASWSHESFSAVITQLSLRPTEVSVRVPTCLDSSEPLNRARPPHYQMVVLVHCIWIRLAGTVTKADTDVVVRQKKRDLASRSEKSL